MSLAAKYGNWVAETTATTGTGTLTLAGALAGTYAAFSGVFTDGDAVYYHIFDRGSDSQEAGLGTYSAGTVTRGPTSTLVGGVYDADSPAAIALSGNAVVYASLTAETSTLFATEIEARLRKDGSEPMTGELILSGNATQDLAAVPKQQLDAAVSQALTSAPGINLVDNGSFTVWQRGTGPFAGNVFHADRWRSTNPALSTSKGTAEGTSGQGLAITASSSTSQYSAVHCIELTKQGIYTQFRNKTLTLSFSIKCTENASYFAYVAYSSDSGGTSLVSIYTAPPQAIPDTTGTHRFTGTFPVDVDPAVDSVCLLLNIGATLSSASSTATVSITDVQLEEGEVATPFEIRHPAVELARCNRYYRKHMMSLSGYAQNTSTVYTYPIAFESPMRVTPATGITVSGVLTNISACAPSYVQTTGCGIQATASAAGNYAAFAREYSFDAEF
jgi:hypothetical protein